VVYVFVGGLTLFGEPLGVDIADLATTADRNTSPAQGEQLFKKKRSEMREVEEARACKRMKQAGSKSMQQDGCCGIIYAIDT
jgi:hypothetical protein